jgi:hypothetical protein
MKKSLLSIIFGCALFLACGGNQAPVTSPYAEVAAPTVTNNADQFVITFSGHVQQSVVDQRLTFSSRKVKLSIISGNTCQKGNLIIQLYLQDGSMPYSKTFISDGPNLTLDEIFSLDSVPDRIIVDINDYAAGFTLELLAVQ